MPLRNPRTLHPQALIEPAELWAFSHDRPKASSALRVATCESTMRIIPPELEARRHVHSPPCDKRQRHRFPPRHGRAERRDTERCRNHERPDAFANRVVINVVCHCSSSPQIEIAMKGTRFGSLLIYCNPGGATPRKPTSIP